MASNTKQRAVLSLISVLSLSRGVAAAFGNALSTGPVASGNFIREATSTLVVPAAPNPEANLLSLWVGMGMSNGDLIQALTESFPGTNGETCGELNGEWCSWASVLPYNDPQTGGKQVLTPVGSHVTMHYKYNDATDSYDQDVAINGEVISTFTSSKGGRALGWGTAEECQPGTPCGYVGEHQWIDTTLIMDSPDANYGSTVGTSGASGSFSTPDGGKTWQSSSITINAFTFS